MDRRAERNGESRLPGAASTVISYRFKLSASLQVIRNVRFSTDMYFGVTWTSIHSAYALIAANTSSTTATAIVLRAFVIVCLLNVRFIAGSPESRADQPIRCG